MNSCDTIHSTKDWPLEEISPLSVRVPASLPESIIQEEFSLCSSLSDLSDRSYPSPNSAGSESGNGMVRMTSRLLVVIALLLLAIPVLLILHQSDEAQKLHSLISRESVDTTSDMSYGVIMDAGSTGTRLFLYYWTSNSDNELIDIKPVLDENGQAVVKKVSPGLSSFADKPDKAAEYIRPLLEYATKFIPAAQVPFTPLFLMATAGMRLVPEDEKQAILSDLHTKLPQMTQMQVMKEHIRVIEGKWEGIYSWIAINYILGKFNPISTTDAFTKPNSKVQRQHTVGMIDMGGASCQIAFEQSPNDNFQSENVENINLGCRDDDPGFKYKLYVTTFLGYGVNEGLRKYEQDLSDNLKLNNGSYTRDSCMPVNLQKTVIRDDKSMFVRKGIGDWPTCVARLGELLEDKMTNDDKPCEPQCFFHSVSAPQIDLSNMEFYGFSEYWYSTHDVLGLGGEYNFSKIMEKSKQFCSQRWSAIQSAARQKLYPKADDDRLKSQCFKSAWITAVLHNGFAVDKQKNKFKSALTISGQEVQWALGAMIYNMRYFPLKNSQTHVIGSRHPASAFSSFSPLLTVLILLCLVGGVYIFFALQNSRKRRGLFNNNSWGYSLLQNDDILLKSPFRNVSFA